MLPELGHFALILALLLAGLQAFFGIGGAALARERWMAAVTPAVAGQAVMVATAVAWESQQRRQTVRGRSRMWRDIDPTEK